MVNGTVKILYNYLSSIASVAIIITLTYLFIYSHFGLLDFLAFENSFLLVI